MTADAKTGFLPGRAMQLAQRIGESLSQELASSFQVWARHQCWFHLGELGTSDIESSGDVSEAVALAHLEQYQDHTESILVDLSDDRCLLIVPITANELRPGTLAVIGEVPQPASRTLLRLAMATVRNVIQEQSQDEALAKIRGYVRQVTSDFEELTWLRGLAERMEVCDLQNDLPTVAGTVLPSLNDLIQAEAILLFTTLPKSDEPAATPCYSVGRVRVPQAICRELINTLRSSYRNRPLIENADSRNGHIPRWPGVRNYIVARLTRETSHFGWLLAVNKSCERPGTDNIPLAGSASEWEFGTFEGGLVNSAAVMLATHGRNVELFNEKEAMLLGVIRALINAIDAKDTYTCGHSDRVACFAKRIAAQLHMSNEECERIYMSGLLHDIGKIGVPDDVLCKPGKLTEEEFAQIKKHPEIGYTILKHLTQLSYVLPGVLHHHESFDGRGYPHGLAGHDIPLYGRILAVADAYDAMTSSRPYRSAMPCEKAEAILREGSGKQWDSQIVKAFFDALQDIRDIRQRLLPQTDSTQGAPLALSSMQPEHAIHLAVTTMARL